MKQVSIFFSAATKWVAGLLMLVEVLAFTGDTAVAQNGTDYPSYRINVDSLIDLSKRLILVREQLKKAKEEIYYLQLSSKEYLDRIESLMDANDSLKRLNESLSEEKQTLTYRLNSAIEGREQLMDFASRLKVENLILTFYEGDKKTTSSRKTDKAEVCFYIPDNYIASSGKRNVYVRITEPGGKTIGGPKKGSGLFTNSAGEDVMYTTMKSFDYSGKKTQLCVSYVEEDDGAYVPGRYLVEVYIDKALAGAGSAILK
jgi:hypothetical protein